MLAHRQRGPRGLDMTHQQPQTGDLLACWAFVPHYYQAVIRQAHGQPSIPSEGSSLSPSSLPPHAVTIIQTNWGLAGVIEMLRGNILLHLHMKKKKKKKKNWKWQKGSNMILKEEDDLASFITRMWAIRISRAPSIMRISWHEKTSIWSLDRFILTGQAYLPIFTFNANSERGFTLSADKHAS